MVGCSVWDYLPIARVDWHAVRGLLAGFGCGHDCLVCKPGFTDHANYLVFASGALALFRLVWRGPLPSVTPKEIILHFRISLQFKKIPHISTGDNKIKTHVRDLGIS